jgi:hypothetical protein
MVGSRLVFIHSSDYLIGACARPKKQAADRHQFAAQRVVHEAQDYMRRSDRCL